VEKEIIKWVQENAFWIGVGLTAIGLIWRIFGPAIKEGIADEKAARQAEDHLFESKQNVEQGGLNPKLPRSHWTAKDIITAAGYLAEYEEYHKGDK
jgi:hypothetical protein